MNGIEIKSSDTSVNENQFKIRKDDFIQEMHQSIHKQLSMNNKNHNVKGEKSG